MAKDLSVHNGFLIRLTLLILFLGPLVYLSCLVSTAIHEILGHGLAALSVGGTFTGFTISLGGEGEASAFASADSPEYHEIIIRAAGVIAETLTGIVFLLFALGLKKRLFLHLALLVLAVDCLLNAFAYMGWNAYRPVPPGDIATILGIMGSSPLRWMLVAFGGGLTLGAMLITNALVLRAGEEWLGPGRRLRGIRRILALGSLFVGQAISQVYGWNQLAPGIGHWPEVVGVLLSLLTLTVLYF